MASWKDVMELETSSGETEGFVGLETHHRQIIRPAKYVPGVAVGRI